ncbi:MAG: transcriptional regulator NrdR, partial [Elusimicrobia bacterium RIFOXYA12_FULL_57_11]
MKCPFCGAEETKVTDSRDSSEAFEIRRRRECEKCEKRFTTYERIETHPLVVIKKDGRREGFSREKLIGGIIKSCQKRNVSMEKMEEAGREIESSLRSEDKSEVPSSVIGGLVARKLKKLDKVAYIRFASIYKDFEDVTDFEK